MTKHYAIIVAGGKGLRMGKDLPKQFLELQGSPILMHTIRKFHQAIKAIKIIVVLPESQIPFWNTLVEKHQFTIPHEIIKGGKERFFSVKNGLSVIERDGIVAIHDGVRPLVNEEVIRNSFKVAEEKGNAITSISLKDSIRSVNGEGLSKAEDRSLYRLVQTPQTFRGSVILDAFNTPYQSFFTDDASVIEHAGHEVVLIEGNNENIKITTPEDLLIGEVLLG